MKNKKRSAAKLNMKNPLHGAIEKREKRRAKVNKINRVAEGIITAGGSEVVRKLKTGGAITIDTRKIIPSVKRAFDKLKKVPSKALTTGFNKKPSSFKMKGFSGFGNIPENIKENLLPKNPEMKLTKEVMDKFIKDMKPGPNDKITQKDIQDFIKNMKPKKPKANATFIKGKRKSPVKNKLPKYAIKKDLFTSAGLARDLSPRIKKAADKMISRQQVSKLEKAKKAFNKQPLMAKSQPTARGIISRKPEKLGSRIFRNFKNVAKGFGRIAGKRATGVAGLMMGTMGTADANTKMKFGASEKAARRLFNKRK